MKFFLQIKDIFGSMSKSPIFYFLNQVTNKNDNKIETGLNYYFFL
jgi:hypothetical protein